MKKIFTVTLMFIASITVAQVTGTLTDTRDGKTYKIVVIGKQTWMAENLNYETEDSYCYKNKIENCNTYGRLYTQKSAENACPNGYHLPTNDEWILLNRTISIELTKDYSVDDEQNFKYRSGGALKSTSKLWINNNGATNISGFNALPGGARGLGFVKMGTWAMFRTNTPDTWVLYNNSTKIVFLGVCLGAYSIRCVKD